MEGNRQIKDSEESNTTLLGSVKSSFSYLLRLWWLFLIVGLIAGITGIIFAGFSKPKYQCRATFALNDNEGGGIGNLLNLASQFGINVGAGKNIFSGDNILEVMKSRRIIEQVLTSVDTFNTKPYTLIQYYIELTHPDKNSKENKIRFPAETAVENYTYQQDSVLNKYYKEFSKNLILVHRPDKKLSLFEVQVTTPDEEFSKVFTEKLLSFTNILYTEIRSGKAKQTFKILEDRANQLKSNLDKSLSERATLQDVNINPAFERAEVPILKQQSDIQVYGAAYTELFKNLELARFQYLNEMPLMQVIDKPQYPLEKKKTGKLKSAVIFAFLAEVIVLLILGLRYVFKD